MPSQSEAKAQNVARGHKAAISNPNVSEEAKEHSRQVLEDIEGTSDRDAFVASTGTEKHSNYDSDRAAKTAGDEIRCSASLVVNVAAIRTESRTQQRRSREVHGLNV
ncbi:Conidiation protein 6-domain-containing protein [Dichomitus squalens]|nr:Conidiation protein 6-domain-containing protein [Dichomitus squalens]